MADFGKPDLGSEPHGARESFPERTVHALPASLTDSDYQNSLGRWTQSRKSGLSAAIWSSDKNEPAEYRRSALVSFHKLTVRLQSQKTERWQDGRKVADEETRAGAWALVRADVEPRVVYYGSFRTLQVYIPKALFDDTAAETALTSDILERLEPGLSYDPVIRNLGILVADEIGRDNLGSALQLDALGSMICVHLLRRASDGGGLPIESRGGLAGWQVRRSMQYIADRVGENPTLAAIAAEVGLSQFHFTRAFKQSTGVSPHRYLIQCRLERAKQLLANTDASVTEIAASVGYSEPTQLSRLFAMEMDTTPSAYRRATASPSVSISSRAGSFMSSAGRGYAQPCGVWLRCWLGN